MKNKIIFILFAAIFAIASAQSLNVIVNSVQPQPVQPGNDLTVQVTFSNTAATAGRVYARLDLSYPFSLKSSTENFESGFDICSLCSRTNTYYIHVDASAGSGIYPIYVRSGDASGEFVRTINVSVVGKPNLAIFSDAITNGTPSVAFDMRVRVANIGTGTARQISVSSPSGNFVTLGSSLQTISLINPNSSALVTFRMSPNPDLEAGPYNIPFNLQYSDELGGTYNVTQNVGIQIINEGKLNIQSIKVASASGAPAAGKPVSIIVRIQNVGHGTADSIESELTCGQQSATAFLGQLDRDEDAPAVFDMTLDSGGRQRCTMVTKFTDDLGPHTVTSSFDVSVAEPGSPIVLVIILVIIAGAAYWFLRRRRR